MTTNYGSQHSGVRKRKAENLVWRRKSVAMMLLAATTTHTYFAVANGGPLKDSGEREVGTYIEEVPLWEAGFKVVGRKGNRKRARMVWRSRLAQIGTESGFRTRYKISSQMFKDICDKIRKDVEAEDGKQAARSSGGLISAELKLSMALRYMAGGHYVDIADLHGVEKNEVYRAVRQVAEAINKHYSDRLHFPIDDRLACDKLAEGFYKESGETVPGCIGCVDGIAIPIEKPRWGEVINTNDMWNRKGFFAVVCQAICDHQLKFMWVSSGCTWISTPQVRV